MRSNLREQKMNYFYDFEKKNGVVYKGRIYNVVDKARNHKWYEHYQETKNRNGEVIAHSSLSDFLLGDFLGLSDDDKRKSLKRVSKCG
jgi:hypothetical protein